MLIDLPDARRDKKPWLPADDRDVTNGLVVEGSDGPRCRLHGAMNRVHPTERYYRCSESRCGVGCEVIPTRSQGLHGSDSRAPRHPEGRDRASTSFSASEHKEHEEQENTQ